MQNGEGIDGRNERSSDWNPIQVFMKCRLDWMQHTIVPKVDSNST
jgi:hypothetical protein